MRCFKTVYPVGFQEIDEKDDGTKGPCERVCPENDADDRDKAYDESNVGHPDDAPETEHGKHWHSGFPCAS